MTTRERTMAILLLGLIFLAGGGFLGYEFVYSPLQAKEAEAAKLQKDIDDLEPKVAKLRKDKKRLEVAKKRSLPPDEMVAKQEYGWMMEHLLRDANVPAGYSVTPEKVSEAVVRTAPGQAPKKPPITRIAYKIEFKKADMWAVHDFLTGYYKLNLLHQITALNIKREEDATGAKKANTVGRSDLSVTLVTEAVIVDGADPRRTLLPVPTAFAAVGGWRGYQTVAKTPEAGRGLPPTQYAPVLATRPRDYSLIVRKDPFHSPYVDPRSDPIAVPKPKEDISDSILLVGVVTASDGTAEAMVRDGYNPHNYEIKAGPRGVEVRKYYFAGRSKKLDGDHPKNDLLVISDDTSSTSREFRIIGIGENSLILEDLKPGTRADAKGGRGVPPGVGMRSGGAPRVAVSAPVASVVGAAAAIGYRPPPVYRWPSGKSLKGLIEIPPAEAQKLLDRAAAEGPVVRALAAAP